MEPEATPTRTEHQANADAVVEVQPLVKPLVEPSPVAPSASADTRMNRHECGVCGYVYEPKVGDTKRRIVPGTPFDDLSVTWRCPVCNAKKQSFRDIGSAAEGVSGFEENLGYGFGVNTLTPSQKNLLIFGFLGGAVIFFLSLYALD
ncbi:MAG: rubredoxin [Pseudanabaena sp. ELA607]|jgi:rubredoxin